MHRIYLDANATTPLDPRVRDLVVQWLDAGNASSPHAEGRAAREAIDRARDQVATLIGAHARDIVFTSGATEANALALVGSVRARDIKQVFCSAVEHASVLQTLSALQPAVQLVVGAVDEFGRLPANAPLPAGDLGLVSLMLANNENGAIQPVREIAARAHERGALVHCDAVQACGKMRVDVTDLDVDLLTMSAHKMNGPKGVGALYARRKAVPHPLFFGGEHERGLRAGTENVAAIAGFGLAAELARQELDARRELWARLRDRFLRDLRAVLPDVVVHSPDDGLPNTLSLTFADVEGEAVLLGLDLQGIAVSTGSACSTGAAGPSHVLIAMGLSPEQAERSIRVSMHASTAEEDVVTCVQKLARVVKDLRALQV
ncbi:MAG: cysteine desulfurase [Planctomycetota bacterium]|nr:cysteine desulfurase [Planctomycetota bacterium]